MGFMCKDYGTCGTLPGSVTGTVAQGSTQLTVSSLDDLKLYDYITIAGVSGSKTITSINKLTKVVTLNSAANVGVTGAAVAYLNPTWQQLPDF